MTGDREERVRELVEDISDTLQTGGADINDIISAVFTFASHTVLVLRDVGADMAVVKAALESMLVECENPIPTPSGRVH